MPGRFFHFSRARRKKIPCDGHHCVRGCVGLTFHATSTRIWDGNHVAADSPNHDRRCDGVDRERVGVCGAFTGGRPLGAVAARNPPRRPSGDGSAARCPGTCFVADEAPPPGVVRNANSWYGFTNQRGHPGNGMEFLRTGQCGVPVGARMEPVGNGLAPTQVRSRWQGQPIVH